MKQTTTANRLKQLMRERGISQIELLEACNRVCVQLGERPIGSSSMSQYVNGVVEPKQNRLFVIAKAFDVSPTWLMGYDVPEQAETQTDEEKLIDIYRSLNTAGQQQLMLQAQLLSESDAFKKDTSDSAIS